MDDETTGLGGKPPDPDNNTGSSKF